jgi:hypothetical protein
MMALNSVQPFVSEGFAKKIALLVLDDRYPKDAFLSDGTSVAVDEGDVWLVTFKNSLSVENSESLPMVNGVLIPRTLTLKIRKRDAAILDIF